VKNHWLFACLVLAVGFARAASAEAADAVLAAATDLPGAIMFMESHAPGMVLVAVRGSEPIIRGYGETAPGSKKEPDGNALVRLNSITKVFATEALGTLAVERKLALTDALQTYLHDVHVPDFNGQPMTLLDLATHTAALPREMGEAPRGAPPRTWPTFTDRMKWLATYQLPWAPGTIASYSNVGFDLLADALAAADGKPYPDVLRTRITDKLGMADTTLKPSEEQCARLMTGTGLDADAPCTDTSATGGSGGLYSTGNDMARWLRHNLALDDALVLSQAVYWQRQALAAAIGFDEAGPMSGLAMGWVLLAGDRAQPTLLAKTGGGAGFMSYIAFAPGRGAGVFVVINRTDFGVFKNLVGAVHNLIGTLVTR
jgi:serine-type D-Ala-D-Ala carboxypeptidase/endopeptidase